MNKNTFWILIASFLIVAFGLGFFSGVMVQNKTPSYVDNGNQVGGYPLITEVIKAISSNYVKTVTEKDLAKSMLFGLDPYSTYFTPEEYQTFRNDTEGKYGGIGVVIELDETRRHVRVNQVFSPSPAFDSGVEEGWLILAIENKELQNPDLDMVSSLIRGTPGTKVKITFQNNGDKFVKEITREQISVNTVKTEEIDKDIGYIRLSSFMPQSPKEMSTALENMSTHNYKSYVLDLRRNGGGLLQACQLLSNLFLEPGVLLYTEDRTGHQEVLKTSGERFKYPLVVLVDQYTASASEILAGALQDRGVAVLCGTRTFGKGLVQNVFPINGGYVKMTIERYLTPDKHQVDTYGLKPDIESYVDITQKISFDPAKDSTVAKAVEYLRTQIK